MAVHIAVLVVRRILVEVKEKSKKVTRSLEEKSVILICTKINGYFAGREEQTSEGGSPIID